ncbi:hypothetical protein KC853_03230 [Candidatus Saccharibacteria bacterium]|nr:hypothetical protein [Candidatus Saccharibacteria bacterium]MCB9834402.1 hypothetical protein [Candidatus Nomurabacteria bacterium]
MDLEILSSLGLSPVQAKAYKLLIEKGTSTPAKIAELSEENRTNCYMALDRLVSLGLATKEKLAKKTYYKALNPIAIESLLDSKQQKLIQLEQKIKSSMPSLLTFFYSFTEKPGIRLLEGEEGMKKVYLELLNGTDTIYFLRAGQEADTITLDDQFYTKYKTTRAKLGIRTHAYTTKTPSSIAHSQQDSKYNIIRTWIPTELYTAPVEFNITKDKIAIFSFGNEIMTTVIQSPNITKAFRQLLNLISQ